MDHRIALVAALALSAAAPGCSLRTSGNTYEPSQSTIESPGRARPAYRSYSVIHSFGATGDGAIPEGDLVSNGAGTLYGVTFRGGTASDGTVFSIASDGRESVLHSFSGADGRGPEGGLVRDAAINLYGTASAGGAYGEGCVFKVTRLGSLSVVYAFHGTPDGRSPLSGVVRDPRGNLFGTTQGGGPSDDGTVYKIAADGSERVLYGFTGFNDGTFPLAGLVMDSSGNLYGTTELGGRNNQGVVFKVTPGGSESVLHAFAGGTDGQYPASPLTLDAAGNLYGTTEGGGSGGDGVVFEIASNGSETIVHAFTGGADGNAPRSGVIRDDSGNLYGTTYLGGAANGGTVFKITATGSESVLFNFPAGGANPTSRLLLDAKAQFFGTTQGGGTYGAGDLFRLTI